MFVFKDVQGRRRLLGHVSPDKSVVVNAKDMRRLGVAHHADARVHFVERDGRLVAEEDVEAAEVRAELALDAHLHQVRLEQNTRVLADESAGGRTTKNYPTALSSKRP